MRTGQLHDSRTLPARVEFLHFKDAGNLARRGLKYLLYALCICDFTSQQFGHVEIKLTLFALLGLGYTSS